MADAGGGEGTNKQPVAVVSQIKKRRFSGKTLLAMGAIVVVLVVSFGVGLAISHFTHKKNAAKGPTAVNPALQKENQTVTKINNLSASGDYNGAVAAVNADPTLANSRDGKMLLAEAALNANKPDEALTIYLTIGATYGWNANVADQVAQIYANKGDKQNAVTYYNKEIDLLKASTDPTRNAQIDSINGIIKGLQGAQ